MKQFESFRLDTGNECLWRSGAQIQLPPKPYAILRYLVDNPGRLITHDELLDAIWPETYVQPQVLRTYMLELRKVLGDDAGAPRFIQTIPKRGYCFIATVTESAVTQAKQVTSTEATQAPKVDGLIDREMELDRLTNLLRESSGGTRQFVLLTGSSGIGKTALVDAFVTQLATDLVMVGRGQCIEGLGSREEYYPVMEALSRLCASPEGERACRVLSRMAPHWLPAMEASAPVGRPSERMPSDLCGALEELAAEKSLLLVFEDVHLADSATCSLLSALARRRAPAKLMVLATFRPLEGSADNALKSLRQDLLLRRLCVELVLQPFGRAQVRKLVSRHLGQEVLPPGLDEFVYEHSEGNPLFVIAMLEHLIAQGYLQRSKGDDTSPWQQKSALPEFPTAVPDELASMIELEIGRLNPEDQKLLEAASLIPVAFPAWAVAAALERDPADIEEACEDMARRLYFVRRAGQDELPDGSRSAFYVFTHGLYREVLYRRQAPARLARRHVRIAERLGAIFAGREHSVAREVACHYEAAGEWHRAALVLSSAAMQATERGAHAESCSLWDQILRVADNLQESQREQILARMPEEQSGRAMGTCKTG